VARADVMIENARIVDGTGQPAFTGGVAVADGRIAAVGDVSAYTAETRIDAGGRVLAPGFIDVHTHDDRWVLAEPSMTAKISQGVTTVIAGNCGISLAPFTPSGAVPPPMNLIGAPGDYRFPTVAAYRAAVEARPAAVNVALLCGHTSLRATHQPDALDRAATPAAVDAMIADLRRALDEGCIGLSTGLDYPPAKAAPTDEVVALARVVAERPGAVYATHMRDEGDAVMEAVDETLRIGRSGGVPVVVSHHKCSGKPNYGRSVETLAALEAAMAEQAVALDVYPYTASSTSLMPQYVRESEEVLVTFSEPHPEVSGQSLFAVADAWGCSPEEACDRLNPAGAIYFQMDEGDLRRILAFGPTMVGSDGLPGQAKPHPRLWGTFPRVLGRYARDLGVLTLEQAVHKMTGLSARTFALAGRGEIAPGFAADLVVFDAETVSDAATFDDPETPARGIDLVFTAGRAVWSAGAETGARPGAFLTQ
jgi:N-acyl-D-amino-acid deacylase